MVLCICLNPAIDRYLYDDGTPPIVSYGGKAINTAMTLAVLGVPATVIGFVGNDVYSQYDDMLTSRGIRNELIPVDARTRVNTKIIHVDGTITERNERGFEVDTNSQLLLLNKIRSLTNKHDIALLSGSLPPYINSNYMIEILKILTIPFVLDTYPKDIERLYAYAPLLIKPNKYEFNQLAHREINNTRELLTFAKQIVDENVQNLLISLDKCGAIYLNNNLCLKATVPTLTTKSTVGAGDSMIGGYIYAHLQSCSPIDTIVSAVSAGCAHTLTVGTNTMELRDYLSIKKQIKIDELNSQILM